VPQGRNVFPELSVLHNLELGATAAGRDANVAGRIESLMERFPMLRRKAGAQASTLSGGEQKLLEIARGLLLEPKLMLIDEPSIGLSPLLMNETFGILQDLRAKAVAILMVEQNDNRDLEISAYGVVLQLRPTRRRGRARGLPVPAGVQRRHAVCLAVQHVELVSELVDHDVDVRVVGGGVP